MDPFGTAGAVAFLGRLAAELQARREELIALDGLVGDSDLGLTMSKGFAAAAAAVAGSEKPLGKVFLDAGMALARAAPSTMGTLLATGFLRGGKALEGAQAMGTAEARAFWEAFLGGILERGKARPGDKTVVDALWPAVESLKASQAGGLPLAEALSAAAEAAGRGVEDTRAMVAQHGKAACFGEKTRGLQDAGATVGALLLQVLLQQVTGGGRTA